jgi:hypothetical protein
MSKTAESPAPGKRRGPRLSASDSDAAERIAALKATAKAARSKPRTKRKPLGPLSYDQEECLIRKVTPADDKVIIEFVSREGVARLRVDSNLGGSPVELGDHVTIARHFDGPLIYLTLHERVLPQPRFETSEEETPDNG